MILCIKACTQALIDPSRLEWAMVSRLDRSPWPLLLPALPLPRIETGKRLIDVSLATDHYDSNFDKQCPPGQAIHDEEVGEITES